MKAHLRELDFAIDTVVCDLHAARNLLASFDWSRRNSRLRRSRMWSRSVENSGRAPIRRSTGLVD
jgi:hypothetical protein